MANIVQLKRSSVPGRVPDAANVEVGEPVVNLFDQIIFTKDGSGTIKVIGAGTTSNVTEGTNLYFTNARAISALTGGQNISIAANGRITANVTGGSGASVTISNTAPGSATEGDLYWDEDLGKLFIYYTDNDSSQWVEASPADAVSINDNALDQANLAYAQANIAITIGQSAFASSNAKANVADLTTSNVVELTNLYFTNARADLRVGPAFAQANTATTTGQSAFLQANLAYAQANTATTIGQSSFAQANTATTYATSAFDSSNTKVATVAGVTATSISNAMLLDGVKAVDGVGSGLDADTLDGLSGGGSGSYALKANTLAVFASTTSAELAGVISDETGSGSLVFATSPTLAGTPQAPTAVVGTSNTMIATTAFVQGAITTSNGISTGKAIAISIVFGG